MVAPRSFLRAKEPTASYGDLDSTSRRFLSQSLVTLLATIIVVGFFLPLLFMAVTALKTERQIANQSVLPRSPTSVEFTTGPFAGEQYDLFAVPLPNGDLASLALVTPGREMSTFVDPADPSVSIEWVGRWRTLDPALSLDPTFDNFVDAWSALDFLLVLRNTGVIAGVSMVGTLAASTMVAYGLSRFRLPGKRLITASLIATIILPGFVTVVPTYAAWLRLGLVGTWWPLIVPHFFGNAYNVLLLRQFFLSIPRELDDAAAIDGANPMYALCTVIVPQAKGALTAVALFHFFFSWNDFFNPLIYLAGERGRQPISVALFEFFGVFDTAIPLVQAGALLSMIVPVLVFVVLQRVFLSGIDLSGSLR